MGSKTVDIKHVRVLVLSFQLREMRSVSFPSSMQINFPTRFFSMGFDASPRDQISENGPQATTNRRGLQYVRFRAPSWNRDPVADNKIKINKICARFLFLLFIANTIPFDATLVDHR